ncbi:MAG: hypothetical protein EXS37_21005 [Opitutus sp.]|nr:hypothetical protein [Opitutus sp.]
MQNASYFQIRDALDRALGVIAASAGQLSADDLQLKREIELIRSKIVRAESNVPFSIKGAAAKPPEAPKAPDASKAAVAPTAPEVPADPQLTKAPWSKF